jgi:anti-sigma factor RsiW
MLDHPPADLLARFWGCRTTVDENRLIVRHLLAQCPECAARLQQLKRKQFPERAYDEAYERFMAKARRLSAVAEANRPWQHTQLNLLSQL